MILAVLGGSLFGAIWGVSAWIWLDYSLVQAFGAYIAVPLCAMMIVAVFKGLSGSAPAEAKADPKAELATQ